MDHEDDFLYVFFTNISQLCFDKAKEHVEKERETNRSSQFGLWGLLLSQLPQIALAEKSYMELGFLQSKNKGFLRKENSLRHIYDNLRSEIHRLEDGTIVDILDRTVISFCGELVQYLSARIDLIDFYEKVHLIGASRQIKHNELLAHIEDIILKHTLAFPHIALTPVKSIFGLECEILAKLLKAFIELQKLQFLPTLALIYGAHSHLTSWEVILQNRESWKLGFLKNNPLPALYQWLMRLYGAVLSKYSLYFHSILAQQITVNDMRHFCSKLHYDHYQKIANFQRRYDSACILLLSDKFYQENNSENEHSPIIFSYPMKHTNHLENIMEMIAEKTVELSSVDRVIFTYNIMDQCTYIMTIVEPYTYLVIVFENKKTEKDFHISNFMSEMILNLRCSKIFASIKSSVK